MKQYRVYYKEEFDPSQWEELYGEELRPYAHRNFKGLVGILFHLLKEEKREFDLVVGAGNSGSGMVSLVELIYKQLEAPIPPVLRIPTQRYKNPATIWSDEPSDYYDTSALLPDVEAGLKDVDDISEVLYIDDETSTVGLTLKTTLDLILKSGHVNKNKKFIYTAITEDAQELEWEDMDGVVFESFSWAKTTTDLFSVLFYVLPWELEKQLNQPFTEKLDVKELVCILLGAPLRDKVTGNPEFSFKTHERVMARAKNFSQLQTQFTHHLEILIEEGIHEYENKEIWIK